MQKGYKMSSSSLCGGHARARASTPWRREETLLRGAARRRLSPLVAAEIKINTQEIK
jgi:hypothetical protein